LFLIHRKTLYLNRFFQTVAMRLYEAFPLKIQQMILNE
jgi:hypothetical protein